MRQPLALRSEITYPLLREADRDVLLPVAGIFALLVTLVWWTTDGNFTYTLDDPYIHLALARSIFHDTYGINPGEVSAPSSSILWPVLLAPFAGTTAFFEWVPLAINMASVALSALLLRRMLPVQGTAGTALVILLLFSFNAFGLAFTGMEHSLHVLLVLIAAFGVMHENRVDKEPWVWWAFHAALVLSPLVRYEGLAITLPVLAWRAARGDVRTAAATAAVALAGVLGFSWYLHSMGLGLLPSSVVLKSFEAGTHSLWANLGSNLLRYGWLLLAVLLICLQMRRKHPRLALLLASVSALHFVFGKHGQYGRYEVYYVTFVGVFLINALLAQGVRLKLLAWTLPLMFLTLSGSTLSTPIASSNIHHQQSQMAEIARRLDEPVAVNDLGLMALRGQVPVLDLWGLGSAEAMRLRTTTRDGAWIAPLMARKGVEFAFIYDDWFPERPAGWIRVATLVLDDFVFTPASDKVSLYAVSPEAAARLKRVLDGFALDHPAELHVLAFD